MAPRAGTADSRRRALIRAALVEIADRGSLDVTMAQIAGRAGRHTEAAAGFRASDLSEAAVGGERSKRTRSEPARSVAENPACPHALV